jgi:hypothetical protein
MVGLRYLELLQVHWVLIFEMNFVFVVPGQPQDIFVQTDGFLMFEQEVNVLLSEFIWYL